MIKQGL